MKKLVLGAILSLLGLAWPQSARAQFIGDVGLQTGQQILANNVACTGTLQLFTVTNVGQISHQASAFTTAPSFTMEIDGGDGTFSQFRISNPQLSFAIGGGTTAYVVQGNGYYPIVKIALTCTAASFFNLSYSGSQTAFGSIVGPPGGTPVPAGGSIAANVQGVVAQQQAAGGVDPIIEGGLALAINAAFVAVGIDNSFPGATGISLHQAGAVTIVQSVTPSKSGEFGITFEGNIGANTGSTSQVAPWVCVPGWPGGCGATGNFSLSTLSNVAVGTPYQRTWTDAAAGNDDAITVLSSSPNTAIRAATSTGPLSVTNFTFVAGDTVLEAFLCSGTTACAVGSIASSGTLAGLSWQQVAAISTPGTAISGLQVWAATTNVSASGVGSSTATMSTGTSQALGLVVLSGTTPANLNTPAVSIQVDPTGRQIISQDAQAPNQFVCNVTLSSNTTTQCQPAPTTINNIPVRAYVTDIQINTTTAGTTSAIQLKTGTGTNCGTGTANLSAITYADTVANLTSVVGMRTPLIAPLQTAICATQAGAVAGTAIVEMHGFFAP